MSTIHETATQYAARELEHELRLVEQFQAQLNLVRAYTSTYQRTADHYYRSAALEAALKLEDMYRRAVRGLDKFSGG